MQTPINANGNLLGRIRKLYGPQTWCCKVPSICWLCWTSSLSCFLVRESMLHHHTSVFSRLLKSKGIDPMGVIRATFCLFYVYATLLIKDLQSSSISLCPNAGKRCQGYVCTCSKELMSCNYYVFGSLCCCFLEPLQSKFSSLVLDLPWWTFPRVNTTGG